MAKPIPRWFSVQPIIQPIVLPITQPTGGPISSNQPDSSPATPTPKDTDDEQQGDNPG